MLLPRPIDRSGSGPSPPAAQTSRGRTGPNTFGESRILGLRPWSSLTISATQRSARRDWLRLRWLRPIYDLAAMCMTTTSGTQYFWRAKPRRSTYSPVDEWSWGLALDGPRASTTWSVSGFDDGPIRASRFEEAVGIIRRLHSGEQVTYRGEVYQLEDCELSVEPVQKPIPMLLGGGGPRMTRFAAEHADVVGFVPRSLPGGGLDPVEFSEAAFAEKIVILDEAPQTSRKDRPERGLLLFYARPNIDSISTDPDAAWTSPEILVQSPYALVGDTDQMVDTLVERREQWGLTYFTCWEEDIDVLAPVVDRLAGS
jgi:hypothetical protein